MMWAAHAVEIVCACGMILAVCIVGGIHDHDRHIPWTKFIIGSVAGIIGGITGYILGK